MQQAATSACPHAHAHALKRHEHTYTYARTHPELGKHGVIRHCLVGLKRVQRPTAHTHTHTWYHTTRLHHARTLNLANTAWSGTALSASSVYSAHISCAKSASSAVVWCHRISAVSSTAYVCAHVCVCVCAIDCVRAGVRARAPAGRACVFASASLPSSPPPRTARPSSPPPPYTPHLLQPVADGMLHRGKRPHHHHHFITQHLMLC